MNELVSVPISPWYTIPAAVGLLALAFAFAPGVLLHLGVLLYPKGDECRAQFTADLYDVPFVERPFWVAGTLVRCLFEGLPRRIGVRRSRAHLAMTVRSLDNHTLAAFALLLKPTGELSRRIQDAGFPAEQARHVTGRLYRMLTKEMLRRAKTEKRRARRR